MSKTTDSREVARQFSADDARAIARRIIENSAAECHWTAAALDTLTAIILWETLKGEDRPS
jgi:hypothetical protein